MKVRLSLVLLFLCGTLNASTPPPVPLVKTESAKLSNLADNLAYPARVESRVNSMIYSESDGVISKIYAPLGSVIHRGGRLAVIKHTDPVYQYAPMLVVSQVSGIVSQVPVSEGSTVKKGDLIITVTDPAQLRIVIEIAASDFSLFKKGMEGSFAVSDSAEKIKVKVKGISPFVDPSTGTATCELEINQKDSGSLPPGSVGQAYFRVSEHRGFVFPESAVDYRGVDTYLSIVEQGKAKRVLVVLGRRERGNVEILKGIKEGDVVIERSSQFVADGDKVQIETGRN
jgi:multidrug efflux pump subunit AcrA (membrane-fusion protein)